MAGTYFDRVQNKGAVNGRETYDYNEYLKMGGPSLDKPQPVSQSNNSTSPGSPVATPVFNPQDLNKAIEEAIKRQQDAIKPQVDSLNASAPEITAKYNQTRTDLQAQRAPLQDRYNNLIQSIKGQGTEAVNNQTRITNNELGKRGLLGSSTVAQQEIQNAVTPLELKYKTLETTANQDQTDALSGIDRSVAGLATAETADQRALKSAIASLMAGASGQGISTGSSIYGTSLNSAQEQARQAIEQSRQAQTIQLAQEQAAREEKQQAIVNQLAQEQAAREAKQQEIVNQLAQAKLANETAQTRYDTGKPYPSTGGGSTTDISSILSLFGGSTPSLTPGQIQSPARYTLPAGNSSSAAISSRPGLNSFLVR